MYANAGGDHWAEVMFRTRVILLSNNELITVIVLNLTQPYNLNLLVTSMIY